MENLKGKRLLPLAESMWKDTIDSFTDEHYITLLATGNDTSAGIFQIAQELFNVIYSQVQVTDNNYQGIDVQYD